jgi:hypothetical protein
LLHLTITHTHIRDRFCVLGQIADLTYVGDSTSHIVVFLSFSNPPLRPLTTCNAPAFNNLACFCPLFPANYACNPPKRTIGLPKGPASTSHATGTCPTNNTPKHEMLHTTSMLAKYRSTISDYITTLNPSHLPFELYISLAIRDQP